MKAREIKTRKEKTQEQWYEQIVGTGKNVRIVPEDQSLVQPPAYRIIQTFTTYSAYEEPI